MESMADWLKRTAALRAKLCKAEARQVKRQQAQEAKAAKQYAELKKRLAK